MKKEDLMTLYKIRSELNNLNTIYFQMTSSERNNLLINNTIIDKAKQEEVNRSIRYLLSDLSNNIIPIVRSEI